MSLEYKAMCLNQSTKMQLMIAKHYVWPMLINEGPSWLSLWPELAFIVPLSHRVQRGKCRQLVCPVLSSIASYAGCHLPANCVCVTHELYIGIPIEFPTLLQRARTKLDWEFDTQYSVPFPNTCGKNLKKLRNQLGLVSNCYHVLATYCIRVLHESFQYSKIKSIPRHDWTSSPSLPCAVPKRPRNWYLHAAQWSA